MVALVGGNSIGLSLSSLATLGQRGVWGQAQQGRNGETAYVNVTNGNFVFQDRDDQLVGHGLAVSAVRTYNSQGSFPTNNQDHWSTGTLQKSVKLNGQLNKGGSRITRTDQDGAQAVYVFSNGVYVSTEGAGAHDTIRYDAATTNFVWTDGDTRLSERYQSSGSGALLSVSDPRGNTVSYTYNADGTVATVTDSSGEVSSFVYTGGRRISEVRTVYQNGAGSSMLTRVRYGYDSLNRLVQVTVDLSPEDNSVADGNVYVTTYSYDGTSSRIASVTQSDGTSMQLGYVLVGADYRVATFTDGAGNLTQFAYDTTNRKTFVTDPLGLVTTYEYDTKGQLTRVTAPAVSGVSQVNSFSYDASGNVTQLVDGEGHVLTMAYDAYGNQTLQRDDLGNTITRTYGTTFNQLLTETVYVVPDPDGAGAGQPGQPQTTRYVYDSRNELRFVITPEGRVTEHRYASTGERLASIQYTAAAYDVSSLPATAVPTEAQMATWAAAQDKTRTQRVDLVYDFRGQLSRSTSYASVDAGGSGIGDGSEAVTTYVYDQAGQLLKTISPNGGVTRYTYDGLGRVLTATDALLNSTVTQYDDAHNATVVRLVNGLATTSSYDKAGRLISVAQSDAAAHALGTTTYAYDADGRLRMTVDATGVRQHMLYDEAGRKVADIDGDGTLTEYRYDKNNQLTCSIRYATAVDTSALIDGAGEPLDVALATLRPAPSADDRGSWWIYDAASRLVKTVDAQGAVSETRYDGAGRAVTVVHYANTIDVHGLGDTPGAAEASPAASADDRTERRFYNKDGLLTATLDAEGYRVEYQYDAAGRRTSSVAYAADAADDIRHYTLYNARGQVTGAVDGEGYLTESVYDADGNVQRRIRYEKAVAYSAGATLASLRQAASGSKDQIQTYRYTALDQLQSHTDAQGVQTTYVYDSVGRLVQSNRAVGTLEHRTLSQRYDLQGRLIGELGGEGSALLTGNETTAQVDAIWASYGLTHTYDAASRRTSTVDANGHRTAYLYDADGRLRYTVNALGEIEARDYNALGDLIAESRLATRLQPAALSALSGGIAGAATIALLDGLRDSVLDTVASYTYNATGTLAAQTDALGKVTRFGYNAFGEEVSRTTPVDDLRSVLSTRQYDRRGVLRVSIDDVGGIAAKVVQEVDAFGRVTSVTDAIGHTNTVHYDRLGRVVTTTDPLHASRVTTYDAFSRVLTQTDALQHTTTYAYDDATRSVTMTTAEGVAVKTVRNRHGQTHSITDGNGNVTQYSYDRNGDLLSTTTPLTTEGSSYDHANRLVETTDRNGHKVRYEYDAANRVLARRVDPNGLDLTTRYEYDAKGQRITAIDANQVATVFAYDRKGQVLSQTVDPADLNLRTTYSYDDRGQVLTVTSPGDTVTQYVYDALGRRVEEHVDPQGLDLTRSYGYDDKGNVLWSRDANGGLTRYEYDEDDRVRTTVDAAGGVTVNTYEDDGRVLRTMSLATPLAAGTLAALPEVPDWNTLRQQLRFDAATDSTQLRRYDRDGRLRFSVDGAGGVTELRYDANGNVVERIGYATKLASLPAGDDPAWLPAPAIDAAHDQHLYSRYDALNRAAYTVDATGALVALKYDGNGNMTERVAYAAKQASAIGASKAQLDALVAALPPGSSDARLRRSYDAANRLSDSVDGVGAVTQYTYDRNGNLVSQVLRANAIAADARPESVVASADDRRTGMAYDAANRLVFQVDALGGASENSYDDNGNVVRRAAYDVRLPAGTALDLQTISALLPRGAAGNRYSYATYDAANRMVYAVDAQGALSETRYDAKGNVTARVSYANLLVIAGRPERLSATNVEQSRSRDVALDRTTTQVHDADDRVVYAIDAEGYVTYMAYDALGRVTSTTLYDRPIGSDVLRTLQAVSNALRPNAAKDRTQTFDYDAAGRLKASSDALQHEESFTYDALGNKRTFTNKNGATWTYDYDAAGRLVLETSPELRLTTVSLVGGKLVASDDVPATVKTELAYDALGNLTRRTEVLGRPEQRTTTYEYDALGRQVKTIYPAVDVYDAQNDPLVTLGTAARADRAALLFSETRYNALGDAVASRDVTGHWSYKTYDALGRVSYDIDAEGYATGYTHDVFGNVTSLTRYAAKTGLADSGASALSSAQVRLTLDGLDHGADRIISTTYDKLDRATEVDEPTAYVYDATHGSHFYGQKKTFNEYDAFGQLVHQSVLLNESTHTTADTWHYFDRRGTEYATIDALGYITLMDCDAAGNLVTRTELATATARADKAGWDVVAYAPEDRTTEYAYDLANRKTRETRKGVEGEDGQPHDLVTTYGYDAVGNLTRTTDAAQGNTYSYYDALGRVTAVAAPTRRNVIDGTELTPFTAFRRDAHGNVLVQVDYAHGATGTPAESVQPQAMADADNDRRTYTRHDAHGHALEVMDANGYVRHMSYDSAGRLAKQWQSVTSDGVAQTQFSVTSYDRLGHQVKVVDPASDTAVVAGMAASFASASSLYSEHVSEQEGSTTTFDGWSGNNTVTLDWSGVIDLNGGAVRVQVDFLTAGASPQAASKTLQTSAAAAAGGVTLSWSDGSSEVGGISSISYVRVWQQDASGTWVVRFAQSGDLRSRIVAGSGSVVTHETDYNAFGEVERTRVDGELAEYYLRDGAGHVWRTNAGDGVDKVMLYDAQGNVTAEIRSSVQNAFGEVGSASMLSAEQVDRGSVSGERRTDMQYDLLGRMVQQTAPERSTAGVGVRTEVASATSMSNAVLSSAQPSFDENGHVTGWSGSNSVRLNWTDLAPLGNGAVEVEFDYVTATASVTTTTSDPNVEGGGSTITTTTTTPGVARSRSAVLPANANSGTTIEWSDPAGSGDGGIDHITHVRVYKQDAAGNWRLVIDSAGSGSTGTRVLIPKPTDATGPIEVQVRQAGQGDWRSVTTIDFGDALLLQDDSLSSGDYEYQVLYAGPQDQDVSVKSSGQIAFTLSALGSIGSAPTFATATTSVLSWADPGSGVVQTFHYRAVGSGAWQTASVAAQGSGRSGVDLAGLSAGSYEYELLYAVAGQTYPYAHATGSVTVTAGTPPQQVPPVGLPHIATTLSVASADIGGNVTGYDEAGQPIFQTDGAGGVVGTTRATVIRWSADYIGAQFRFRPVGASAWSSLAGQYITNGVDESGHATGLAAGVNIDGLAIGDYDYELLVPNASAPTAHLSGTLNVAPPTAGHYETVTVAVQVPLTVTPEDPSHFIVGYTNSGPTYGPPVVVGYDAYGNPVYGTGYAREILSYNESGPVYGDVIAVPYTTYVTEYQEQQVAVQVVVGSEPVVVLDEDGNPVLDESGNPVYATDESGNILYQPVYETQYVTQTVAVQVPVTVTPEDPSHFIIGTQGSPIYGAPVIVGYDAHNAPIFGTGYGLVNGVVSAIPYTTYQTQYQQQQVWVDGTAGTPTLADSTPAYTPGYTIAGTPATYAASVNAQPGSTAISLSAAQQGGSASLTVQAASPDSARPVVRQVLDRWGNVLEVTDPRSLYWKTTYTYNANNQVTRITRPDGDGSNDAQLASITRYRYDALGRLTSTIDANGNVTTQDYDAGGNLVAEHHADGGTVTHGYDAFGDRTATVDAMHQRTEFKYDHLGHLTEARHGAVQRYDVANHVGDQPWQLVNDTNQLVSFGSQQLTEQYGYDELGRRVSVSNGNGELTRTTYDLRGNVIAVTQPMGEVTRSAFDANNRKIAEIDANGLLATWRYDYFGQVLAHTDIGGAVYRYDYDGARQLVEQSNTRGQHRRYSYDGAGQLIELEDLALNQTSKYVYDLAGNKLSEQTWATGALYQDNRMAYDAQGRLRLVTGLSGVRMDFSFDKAGNRIRQQGRVLQTHTDGSITQESYDHWYRYDAMNRQTAVDAIDAQGHISQTQGHQLGYDYNGNRISDTHGGTLVTSQGGTPVLAGYIAYRIDAETGQHVTLMDEGAPHVFATDDIAYDAGGRPYVVSWSSADGGTWYVDGVEEYYVTPPVTYHGVAGLVTERYAYDTMDRLASVSRDDAFSGNQVIDKRLYDGAGRVLQTGAGGGVPQQWFDAAGASVNSQTRINRYDPNGRLQHQTVLRADSSAVNEIAYTKYDALGNLLQYRLRQHADEGFTNTYDYELKRYEGYKEGVIHGSSTLFESGTTTDQYDVNGFLVGVNDATKGENNRQIVNDAAGMVLQSTHNGQAQRELLVNGQLMGRYGVGLDELRPRDDEGNPRFTEVADFTPTFRSIDGNYPSASVGSYTVVAGDTLQGIAQAAYGDARLWWKIAQANGIGSASELRVGQTLSIPSVAAGSHNANGDYRAYDPTKVVGDTTPNLPAPSGDDCGGLGQILVVVVAVVVTIVTAIYLGPQAGAKAGMTTMEVLSLSLANPVTAAAAFAAGNIAGQFTANLAGLQDGFDWKSVALSAIGGAVGAPLMPAAGASALVVAARVAISNALTQTIGVATGLQKKFSWQAVAAAAVGAGVGQAVGEALGKAGAFAELGEIGGALARASVKGLVAGVAATAAKGGKFTVQQVATDAFGNALGESLAGAAMQGSQQTQALQGAGPWSDLNYRNGSDIESDNAYEARRNQEWIAQDDDIMARRARETAITPAQRQALNAGAGPLTAAAAQEWAAFDDEPIGPAANGRQLPPSKAQQAASAAVRARIAKTASDFWGGTGEFAPTTPDNQSVTSALKDTGRAVWNLGLDALSLVEMADPMTQVRRSSYRSVGIELPSVSDFRATYDTPAFGLTVEVLAPLVPAGKLLGAPRLVGGAAFVEGKFVHDLKPLTNLELYGTAATRTPDEALQLLQRVGHDPQMLAQYRVVKLSDEAYARRAGDLGFDFDATYGTVPRGAPSVTFSDNIASKMADGTSRIPIYVRKEIFESDEALVQVLSHEISETQELKYLGPKKLSTTEYKEMVRPDRVENLHWQAVKDGDWWLQRFRDMLAGKK